MILIVNTSPANKLLKFLINFEHSFLIVTAWNTKLHRILVKTPNPMKLLKTEQQSLSKKLTQKIVYSIKSFPSTFSSLPLGFLGWTLSFNMKAVNFLRCQRFTFYYLGHVCNVVKRDCRAPHSVDFVHFFQVSCSEVVLSLPHLDSHEF